MARQPHNDAPEHPRPPPPAGSPPPESPPVKGADVPSAPQAEKKPSQQRGPKGESATGTAEQLLALHRGRDLGHGTVSFRTGVSPA